MRGGRAAAHRKRCDLSMVMAVMSLGCLLVAYLCSSSSEETMAAGGQGGSRQGGSGSAAGRLAGRGAGRDRRRDCSPAAAPPAQILCKEAGAACVNGSAAPPTRGGLCVGGSAGAAAVDVVRDEVDLLAVLVRDGRPRGGARVGAQHHAVLRWPRPGERCSGPAPARLARGGAVAGGRHAAAPTLKITPAIVVPVFQALGRCMPFFSSMSLRLHRSKLKPPALEPMATSCAELRCAAALAGGERGRGGGPG